MNFSSDFLPLIVALAVWDLVWKGIGLWHAAKNRQKYWFVAILLINSAGILPIFYLWCCDKKR